MKDPIIGIDLGTTNSAVAVVEDGVPKIIPVEGQPSMPSCVGLDDHGNLLVGQSALNQLAARPEATVISIKRKMGTDATVALGEKEYTPEEISSLILGRLKQAAEEHLGHAIKKAVITVPAYFDEEQRRATMRAASLADLEAARIINEPTAAALAYDAQGAANQTLLVYDLGGGTFDVSIVVVEDGVVEVKASHGDTQLGGDDFDQELVKHACAIFQSEHKLDLDDDLKAQRRLKVALERAKRTLTDQPYVRLEEDFLKEDKHLTIEISRDAYESMIEGYLRQTLNCLQKALKDASLSPRDLDKILLVGGASRTPAVSALIEGALGMEPRFDVNPDLIVALGAAVQGASLAGEKSQSILVDITPHSFQTTAVDRAGWSPMLICVPLIKRNTPLPCRKAEAFTTAQDYQEMVIVEVYQGESSLPSENVKLGDFQVTGLSRVPIGNVVIIEFALDLNGMLTVTATEKSTGLSREVRIDTSSQSRSFDLELARENLAGLRGGSDEVLLEVVEEGSEGKGSQAGHDSLLAEAKQLRKRAEALAAGELDEEDQEEIEDLIERTKASIKAQDWETVIALNQNLSDVIFYLED